MLENDKFSRTKCRGIIVKRGARLEKRNTVFKYDYQGKSC